jgi:hypothetical protein
MAFTKKAPVLPPADDEELEPDEPVAPPAAAKKKPKGKMPMPGAGTPAWKKIAAAMAESKKG